MSERNARAKSLQRERKPSSCQPQAWRDFPEEARIYSLLQVGLSLQEARDMTPDESERFIALHNAHLSNPADGGAQQASGPRKATQDDINAFLGRFGGFHNGG